MQKNSEMNTLQNSILATTVLILFSCNSFKKFIIGPLTFEIPNNWIIVPTNGIDSQTGFLIMGNKDTLYYDLGYYGNSLTEPKNLKLIPKKFANKIDSSVVDMSNIIFVEDNKMDIDLYYKQNVTFKNIDNYQLKLVFPRRPGIGITGLHIDSLSNSLIGRMKFTIYANNLPLEFQNQALEIFEKVQINNSHN